MVWPVLPAGASVDSSLAHLRLSYQRSGGEVVETAGHELHVVTYRVLVTGPTSQ